MFDDYNIPDHMGDIQGDILACKTMSVSDLFSAYTSVQAAWWRKEERKEAARLCRWLLGRIDHRVALG
jgi:hypothetical protein